MEDMSEDLPEGTAVGTLVGTAVGLYYPLSGHGAGWRAEGGLSEGGLRGGARAADDGAPHLSRTELATPRLWLGPT
jgi:hypothetical protein